MSIYYLLAICWGWIFPTKQDRKDFRHFCKKIDSRNKIDKIYSRYKLIEEKLKDKYKKEKIKVVFLNDTPAKWQYHSLYEELKNNPNFEVQVLVTVMNYQIRRNIKSIIDYKTTAIKCFDFFNNQDMNVEYAFDFNTEKPIDLRTFSPDIVFYEQPWGLFKIHNIDEVSKYALTCYSCYGSCITNTKDEYGSIFFKTLYKYFTDNDFHKMLLELQGAKQECIVVSGHSKFDNYELPIKSNFWKTNNKKKIIIAPHFSFFRSDDLCIGTFDRNYKFFLEYAKTHQEFEFAFKPHPRLKEEIVLQKLMTFDECQDYYKQWALLPNCNIFEDGNYIDLFKTSDLLITDSNSFLYEYLPTQKPLIHITNNFNDYNILGQKILECNYSAYENAQIENLITQLLVNNNDPLKEKRITLFNSGLHPKEGYAKFVANTLDKILNS